MYKEHETFNSPRPDAVLWRYMDLIKFVSILKEQALFFTRADKLGDPFEGAWPNPSREAIQKFSQQFTYLNHHTVLQAARDYIKALPRFTLINCWHESPHESAAMWKLYSKDDNGIAIKTNFDSLAKSFISSEVIHIGKISYIDYDSTDIFSDQWWFRAFLCKRRSFEHEHEVRAIIQIIPPVHLGEGTKGITYLSQDIYDVGNHYKVDLSLLIKEVIVSPYAPNWHLELIKSVTDQYKLDVPVTKSRLADKPIWD